MGFDGWFFKGGSTQNRWLFGGVWNVFLLLLKIKRPGRLFRQARYVYFFAYIFLIFGDFFRLFLFTVDCAQKNKTRPILLLRETEKVSELRIQTKNVHTS